MSFKNLYVFTGKGGVGKTTLSIAFAKYLQEQGQQVIHCSFKNQALDSNTYQSEQAHDICKKHNIPSMSLDLEDASTEYMRKKLGSKMIASWISKTPFFRALINMIPGFNYLIYLGKIFEMIIDSGEKLICVLDSPSSGHALTMLESTQNFRDIFQSGIVFDDTKKMLGLLYRPGFTQINILTLPHPMSIHESLELKEGILKLGNIEQKIFCNNSLLELEEDIQKDGPDFLKDKLETQKMVLKEFEAQIAGSIPKSISDNPKKVLEEIVPSMKNLV